MFILVLIKVKLFILYKVLFFLKQISSFISSGQIILRIFLLVPLFFLPSTTLSHFLHFSFFIYRVSFFRSCDALKPLRPEPHPNTKLPFNLVNFITVTQVWCNITSPPWRGNCAESSEGVWGWKKEEWSKRWEFNSPHNSAIPNLLSLKRKRDGEREREKRRRLPPSLFIPQRRGAALRPFRRLLFCVLFSHFYRPYKFSIKLEIGGFNSEKWGGFLLLYVCRFLFSNYRIAFAFNRTKMTLLPYKK